MYTLSRRDCRKLGYDPDQNPPRYGKPDKMILSNDENIYEHEEFWAERRRLMLREMEKPNDTITTLAAPAETA